MPTRTRERKRRVRARRSSLEMELQERLRGSFSEFKDDIDYITTFASKNPKVNVGESVRGDFFKEEALKVATFLVKTWKMEDEMRHALEN